MIRLLDDAVRIPPEAAADFAAFRRWTKSREFPDRGDYFFLGDELWIDFSMETLIHNQIKLAIALTLGGLIESLGRFFADRMRLVHEETKLSVEPDAMFASHAALKAGRVRWEQGRESLEVIGTPDMVLEIVSSSSVNKDTLTLREMYAKASIPEYWLVNPLGQQLTFDILRLKRSRYAATRKSAGWLKSAVFDKSFRLVAEDSSDNLPRYRLLVQ